MLCHRVALFSSVLENKLRFHIFSDGSPSLMHRGLYCHRHRGAVFTLFCVSKGGSGVQGITAVKKQHTSKKQKMQKSRFCLYYLEMKLSSDLSIVCMTLLSIIFHLIFHTQQEFDVRGKIITKGIVSML